MAVLLLACKRENCPFPGTKVEGIVIDDSTQKPIEGATIYLQRKKCKIGLTRSTCNYIDVKTVESDINGNFKLKFCKSNNRDYYILAIKDGYRWAGNKSYFQLSIEEFFNSDRIIRMKQ